MNQLLAGDIMMARIKRLEKELAELKVIQNYLPEQMGEDELVEILKSIIEKVGASGPQDMGKVMGIASKQLSGKADGQTISTHVKSLLIPS